MTTTLSTPSTRWSLVFVLLCLLILIALPGGALAQSEQVQVVLFYSPFCGHCQQLISEELPPIVQALNTSFEWSYFGDPPNEETGQLPQLVAFEGDVLQILYVDTTTEIGGKLYMAAVERFQIGPDDQVVPLMIVGEQLLIGGVDIPDQLPGLVESWRSNGGLTWPEIDGLENVVSSLVPFPDQVQASPTPESGSLQDDPSAPPPQQANPDPATGNPSFELDVSKLTVLQRIQLDPLANTLSIVVLIGMLFSIVGAWMRWRVSPPQNSEDSPRIVILILLLLGIGIASYLSFVETSGTEAVCGPVGDCNTVQASDYARLFGILPVGILGLAGYLGMLLAWILARRTSRPSYAADIALFGLSLFGTGFSIYLTFLEPFVIGATCLWCLSSAIIITVVMLLSVDRANMAYKAWRS